MCVCVCVCKRQREHTRTRAGSFLRGFNLEVSGRSQQHIHQLSSCVSPGLCSPLIGGHQSRESLVNAAGPEDSHGIALPGFAAFLGLELKHS